MSEMNWAACPAYKCVDLTMQTVRDLLNQDIPTQVVVVDNSPDDVLHDALVATGDPRVNVIHNGQNIGVGPSWNQIAAFCFGLQNAEHVLIVNNDVRLRPDTYRHLLIPDGGFVTGVNAPQHFNTESLHVEKEPMMRGGPDFSCFLLKRWFSEKVGPFPEVYYPGWFEDNEFHWLARCAGLDHAIFSVPVPYTHIGSQTLKQNPEIQELNATAFERNKQLYIERWGGPPGREVHTTPYGR